MIEPKLCPYRIHLNISPEEYREFGPCLQDECAMWRNLTMHFQKEGEQVVGGYCGLAGKP
jgi:hypothetical protein